MNRLSGKTALVTGAASGIGEGIAKSFATEGAFVFVTDLNDVRGSSVAEFLGTSASYEHLDVRNQPNGFL